MFRETFRYNGKRYDVRAATETDLAVKIALRKKELEEGKETVDGNTLVSVWSEKWLNTYKKPDVSARWFTDIERITKNIILPKIGSLKIKDVRPSHLKAVLNDYKGYSRSYQTKIKDIMHQIFEDARKNRMILENPASELDLPQAKEVQKRRSITEHEREHILKVCKTHRAGLLLMIILNCGLRPSEVARLKWKDVDLKNNLIIVTGKTKTRASKRSVPIPNSLLPLLKKGNPFDFVCTNANGGELTKSSIRQMWGSFIYNLNISMGCETYKGGIIPPYRVADDLVMYNLRHTYCTDLEKMGIPINIARNLMGHSDISITSKIYTHTDEESINQARDKMNEYSAGGNGGGKELSNR